MSKMSAKQAAARGLPAQAGWQHVKGPADSFSLFTSPEGTTYNSIAEVARAAKRARAPAVASSPPVRAPLSERLALQLNMPDGSPNGWTQTTTKRMGGDTAGRDDTYYFSPSGEKFRSQSAVRSFLSGGEAPARGVKKRAREPPAPPPAAGARASTSEMEPTHAARKVPASLVEKLREWARTSAEPLRAQKVLHANKGKRGTVAIDGHYNATPKQNWKSFDEVVLKGVDGKPIKTKAALHAACARGQPPTIHARPINRLATGTSPIARKARELIGEDAIREAARYASEQVEELYPEVHAVMQKNSREHRIFDDRDGEPRCLWTSSRIAIMKEGEWCDAHHDHLNEPGTYGVSLNVTLGSLSGAELTIDVDGNHISVGADTALFCDFRKHLHWVTEAHGTGTRVSLIFWQQEAVCTYSRLCKAGAMIFDRDECRKLGCSCASYHESK
jgi:hypothetical protein